eukprot:3415067-Rhodomonas_salina.2
MDSQGGGVVVPGQKLYIRRKCMRANGQNRGGALLDLSKRLTCSLQILTAHSARACMMCVYATDGHKVMSRFLQNALKVEEQLNSLSIRI